MWENYIKSLIHSLSPTIVYLFHFTEKSRRCAWHTEPPRKCLEYCKTSCTLIIFCGLARRLIDGNVDVLYTRIPFYRLPQRKPTDFYLDSTWLLPQPFLPHLFCLFLLSVDINFNLKAFLPPKFFLKGHTSKLLDYHPRQIQIGSLKLNG